MNMAPALRKLVLSVHLAFAVGWVGAVMAYIALAISAVTGEDTETGRAALIAMELIGWFVIVPLAVATVLTGLVMAMGTPWGLFRHYWVLVTLVLTIILTVVLVRHMPSVSSLADAARSGESMHSEMHSSEKEHTLLHASAGLVVLLGIMLLNMYKPRGLTPWGKHKQHNREREQEIGDTASPVAADAVVGNQLSRQRRSSDEA
jgi:small-conductance mechanosensitive channel